MKAGIHIHTSDVKTTFQKLEANLLKNGVDASANFKKWGERTPNALLLNLEVMKSSTLNERKVKIGLQKKRFE